MKCKIKRKQMNKYVVYVKEIVKYERNVEVVVEASDKDDAKQKALDDNNWKESHTYEDNEDNIEILKRNICEDCIDSKKLKE